MTESLMYGPLELLDPASPFELVALSTDDGSSWGSAEIVESELKSFIQYGTLVEAENWGSKPVVIAVRVRGDDSDHAAALEATLVTQTRQRRNTLKYRAPTASVYTVIDVMTATPVPVDSDLRETIDSEVVFQVKMTCRPFVRSDELVTVPALPASGAINSVVETVTGASSGYAGEAPDGISVTPSYSSAGVTVATVGEVTDGFIDIPVGDTFLFGVMVEVSKTFSAQDTSVAKYWCVDYKVNDGVTAVLTQLELDDATMDILASAPSPDNAGYTRDIFQIPPAENSVTGFRFRVVTTQADGKPMQRAVTVKQTRRTDIRPGIATPRQQLRQIAVKGVMPATGSIAVSHTTDALGDVHLYTFPADVGDYTPACRAFVHNAGTPDADRVSGAFNDLDSLQPWDIPVAKSPEGDYLLVALADLSDKAEADRIIAYTVQATMNGNDLGSSFGRIVNLAEQYDEASEGLNTGYQFLILDNLHLPAVRMASGPTALTVINLLGNVGAGSILVDDIFLYNMSIGQLTRVRCGVGTSATGGVSRRLWVDSPDVDNDGEPRLLRGHAADRSDSFSAYDRASSVDIHEFDPVRGVRAYSITTGPDTEADVSFSYYPAHWYRAPALT